MTTIVGFAGKKQSGKNTAINFLIGGVYHFGNVACYYHRDKFLQNQT